MLEIQHSEGPKKPERLTSPEVIKSFHEAGVTIATWARERGYEPQIVYAVMHGRSKALRGKAHQIAKELGMK